MVGGFVVVVFVVARRKMEMEVMHELEHGRALTPKTSTPGARVSRLCSCVFAIYP